MSPGWFVRRAPAFALIALIVFPFSAPLSVCDLSDLVPQSSPSRTAPLSNTPLRVAVVKDALAQSFPIRTHHNTRVAAALRGSPVEAIDQTTPSGRRTSAKNPYPARPVTKTILRI